MYSIPKMLLGVLKTFPCSPITVLAAFCCANAYVIPVLSHCFVSTFAASEAITSAAERSKSISPASLPKDI
jgi:hypothetical protein